MVKTKNKRKEGGQGPSSKLEEDPILTTALARSAKDSHEGGTKASSSFPIRHMELQQAQQRLHSNPNDPEFQAAIPNLRAKALKLAEAEMSFCSQIAKAKFLKNTNKGTKCFHNMIKSKRMRNNIPSISLGDGSRSTSSKQAWDTVGRDFTAVVLEFFSLGQILKQINHSVIALIPKTKDADKVKDFRPIACCNVVDKVISKIIATRLGPTATSIIDPAQAAFI
ncbi:hypothetical protein Acr_07g0011840 [Actinidia rufa]|uniref:Reverse transcriptase domain-containing protein n=1 Tax=Actinidia rufa TaxID=165716 RepID=A0A7J0EX57_9ERIC|nr:hypothetical protein Acr_07g0011840 [Actinidia rufa]